MNSPCLVSVFGEWGGRSYFSHSTLAPRAFCSAETALRAYARLAKPHGEIKCPLRGRLISFRVAYIIPMPGAPPAGIAGVSSLILATTDSVVNRVDATLVAF